MNTKKLNPATIAIRGANTRSNYNEHAQALFLTSSFTFDNAKEAQELFLGEKDGYTYSRTANPTVIAFEQRMAQIEGAQRAQATSTGMAAISATFMTFLNKGDHLVTSRSLFGTTLGLIALLERHGIEVSFVSQTNLTEWQSALRSNTKMFFLETPSNPLGEIADIAALAHLAHAHDIILAVDNCFCSPAVQTPIALGADISIQSTTKAIDGQGRVNGGIVAGSDELIEKVFMRVRTTGEVLSPFNAWVLFSGLETLFVRMEKQCQNALDFALWLRELPQVEMVYYAGFTDHPQYDLIQKQQQAGGMVIAVAIKGGQEQAWKVVDNVQLFSRTGNFGDVKSTITHPYTTTHARVLDDEKIAIGITPNLLRLSIGLEYVDDLKDDFLQALLA